MWIINMTEISPKLGLNLKRIRTKKKMSQGDIARALEVHRAYVSGIETGKRNPTLSTLEKLANALGVSVSELLK
jgi:transcriptional regulator with XRE-family HTH domain